MITDHFTKITAPAGAHPSSAGLPSLHRTEPVRPAAAPSAAPYRLCPNTIPPDKIPHPGRTLPGHKPACWSQVILTTKTSPPFSAILPRGERRARSSACELRSPAVGALNFPALPVNSGTRSLWAAALSLPLNRVQDDAFRLVHSLCAAAKRLRRSLLCAAIKRAGLRASGGQRDIVPLDSRLRSRGVMLLVVRGRVPFGGAAASPPAPDRSAHNTAGRAPQ